MTEEPAEEGYWERLTRVGPYDTVEQLRDAIDRPDWRQVEAKQRMAERSRGTPPRRVPESLGVIEARRSRQVNVKLASCDFDGLVALAIERDMPPSSLARVLLRRAILDASDAE